MEIATLSRVSCQHRVGMGRSDAEPGIRPCLESNRGICGACFPSRTVVVMSDSTRTITKTSKDVLRKLVPDSLLKQRDIVQRLGSGAGRIYATLRLFDGLGIRGSNRRIVPTSARSFVFVCFGNIMRSAMAEFLMRRASNESGIKEELRILSAGLHAVAGREAHPWA